MASFPPVCSLLFFYAPEQQQLYLYRRSELNRCEDRPTCLSVRFFGLLVRMCVCSRMKGMLGVAVVMVLVTVMGGK